MKVRFSLLIPILLIFVFNISNAQNRFDRNFRKSYQSSDEVLSLSSTMSFEQVFDIFYNLSKKYQGKILISEVSNNFPIGVDIDKMHWLDALELILKTNNLWYEEYNDYYKIVPVKDEQEIKKAAAEGEISFASREVVISAIFFEADGSKLTQLGFSWDFFRGKDVNVDVQFGAADEKPTVFQIEAFPDLDFGSLLAIFKALETDQVGEVVANPQITVRSGVLGKIQVGSDIAVTTKDFAGNTINQFFSTGSIIEVTPMVIQYDTTNFIHLDLKIERSNTGSDPNRIEIKKSEAKTSILLLDGEETVIGGLYVNEEAETREGIPLLKDLPWWFFGLRYVFGYNTMNVIKKELLIVIKAELVPSLEERLVRKSLRKNERFLKKAKLENQLKMQYYLKQLKDK